MRNSSHPYWEERSGFYNVRGGKQQKRSRNDDTKHLGAERQKVTKGREYPPSVRRDSGSIQKNVASGVKKRQLVGKERAGHVVDLKRSDGS